MKAQIMKLYNFSLVAENLNGLMYVCDMILQM